jgi:hypothetical protein
LEAVSQPVLEVLRLRDGDGKYYNATNANYTGGYKPIVLLNTQYDLAICAIRSDQDIALVHLPAAKSDLYLAVPYCSATTHFFVLRALGEVYYG